MELAILEWGACFDVLQRDRPNIRQDSSVTTAGSILKELCVKIHLLKGQQFFSLGPKGDFETFVLNARVYTQSFCFLHLRNIIHFSPHDVQRQTELGNC